MRNPYLGWRYFECNECGTKWRETSRDFTTLSRNLCPTENCDANLHGGVGPHKGHEDLELKGDGFGNLAKDEYKLEILK